ncbi:MAG: KamA family radical SAM protein, partial [Candidatus Omnitrophica bacterium]|nr:KamA family radical SAM protein [Candidatus Omnitrophota bacterium]
MDVASYQRVPLWKDVPLESWHDFGWQMRNRITEVEKLKQVIRLTPSEIEATCRREGRFIMAVPPYWANLMDPEDPACPIRRQAVPLADEYVSSPNDLVDPLAEDAYMPVPGLVHRYPDRVLLLVSEICSMYCRHCTRSRIVGTEAGFTRPTRLEAAYDYLRKTRKVRDVLISGGDPLSLSDKRLDDIITTLRTIPHIEFIRIGSRTPVTCPMRVTESFTAVLKRHAPIWMSLHFNHPKEVTPEVKRACDLLANAGVPMGSQTVLLKGINDKPSIMKKLVHELLKIRVRPYYIYQCDPVKGTAHFRTPIALGVAI